MSPFTTKLRACMTRADMTVSDLAVWFERPRATVNTWVNGRTPKGPSGRLAIAMLETLVWAVRNSTKLPIPEHLSWPERTRHVQEIRDAALRHPRVSSMRSAG